MTNSNNRRRSRSKGAERRRRIIFLLSALCVLSIAVGVAMAATACSEDSDAQPNIPNRTDPDNPSPTILHYANLDSVAIPSSVTSQVKQYEGFKLSFNKDNKTPNWVAWELLGSEVGGEQERYNKFWQDYDLEGCPSTSDYTHSGYDRGHMCPAADQKWSYDAMVDCFVMANMCPQDHSLNAGAWNTLEGKERAWAQRDSALLIVAGPIYDAADTKTIGAAGVRVPGAFFKVMAAPYANEPRGIAFVYPNMSAPGNMEQYVLTIDEVEKLTGFDFFATLPDEIETKIESQASFREWNRR